MRILIVEDDYLIASEVAAHLRTAGIEVVGMAASVKRALKLLNEINCNSAILDFNLGDETSVPIAEELARRKIPFVVLTGYTAEQIKGAAGAVPHLTKPCRPELLTATVLGLYR